MGNESERMMSKCDDLEISGLTHGSGSDQSSHKEKQRFQQENLLGSGADVVFSSEYIEFKILVRHWASLVVQLVGIHQQCGNLGLIAGLGRSPGAGHGNPL